MYNESGDSSDELSNRDKQNLEEEKVESNKITQNSITLVKKVFVQKYNESFDKMKEMNLKAKQRIKRDPIWTWEDEEDKQNSLQNDTLRILNITWNMNAKKPKIDLKDLLRPDIHHDIISVGSEECLKTIFKSAFGANKRKWVNQLQECLGPEYGLVNSHSLMGIHLVIFASLHIIPFIKNVQGNHVATGV